LGKKWEGKLCTGTVTISAGLKKDVLLVRKGIQRKYVEKRAPRINFPCTKLQSREICPEFEEGNQKQLAAHTAVAVSAGLSKKKGEKT